MRGAELFRQLFLKYLQETHCCKLCVVNSVSGNRVTVSINNLTPQGEGYPLLINVPVMVFTGGDYIISMPVEVGDRGMVFFADTDIQNIIEGSNIDATDIHALDDAMFLPRSYVGSGEIIQAQQPGSVTLGKKDGSTLVTINDNGISIAVDGDMNVNCTGEFNVVSTNFNT